jgi:hypothetical protein
MIKIDFKKQNKELYAPTKEPRVIEVPAMKFIMVDGHGDPNDTEGEYHQAVELLYALSYTIKMSNKNSSHSDENYDYVVAPLEGLWWLDDKTDMNFTQKDKYCWTSMIRQPDFITVDIFERAKVAVKKKKPGMDVTKARLETLHEGLCVHVMHIGAFDEEPTTLAKMDTFMKDNGLINDIGTELPDKRTRRHHEIYLSDPRKANPATMKTILRHPIRNQIG